LCTSVATTDPLPDGSGCGCAPSWTGSSMTKTPTPEERRERVRALLRRLSPGTLEFLDQAKTRFPSAKMTALEVTEADGTTHRIAGKASTPPKETP